MECLGINPEYIVLIRGHELRNGEARLEIELTNGRKIFLEFENMKNAVNYSSTHLKMDMYNVNLS